MSKLTSFLLSLFVCGVARAAVPEPPSRLRIIDSFEQLGIDAKDPRFAWTLGDADRGEIQTAYQIVVGSSADAVKGDGGDCWDSGWVKSAVQINVTYAGKPLGSCRPYWYKVRAKDKDGNASPWSAVATFGMGFLQPSDWDKGTTWIQSTLPEGDISQCPMFRREFTLKKNVKRATMYICGLGHYELSINGARIGDHIFDPLWSEYRKTCYYATYDVTANLANGANAIGVTLGNGFYNSFKNPRYIYCEPNYGPKKLIAELHVNYADGSSEKIVSDSAWKFARSPITFSSIYGGEDYDARLEQPGWNRAGFKDAAWTAVVACTGPGGALVSQFAPPVVAKEVYETEPSPSNQFGFAANCAGQPEITVSGEAGSVIKIGPVGCGGYCLYTLKGGGKETWHPAFYYDFIGGYGVQVVSGKATIEKAKLRRVQSAAEAIGTFTCSDEIINRIHAITMESIKSNLQAVLTDCPHREKLGWQEVDELMGPSIMYNFDVAALWSKVGRDCRDSQSPEGYVPATCPNYLGMGGDNAWSSSIIISPWLAYERFGVTRQIEDLYPSMKAYCLTVGDGVSGGRWGDWGNPSPYNDSRGPETGISYHDASIMAQAAALVGKAEDEKAFAAQAANIAKHYNAVFLNNSGFYAWGPSPAEHSSQPLQAIPLDFGFVPPGKEATVENQLLWLITQRDGNHLAAGEIGLPSLWRTLNKLGHDELAYAMITNPTGPSFRCMASPGIRTLAEFFGNGNPGSCHAMLGHVEEWFYSALAGIRPTKPAYEELRIDPRPVGGIASCSASVITPRGLVSSTWTKKAGEFKLEVAIPVGSLVVVALPKWDDMTISESGSALWKSGAATGKAAGIAFLSAEEKSLQWKVGSGKYSFVLTGKEPLPEKIAPTAPPADAPAPLIDYGKFVNVALKSNGGSTDASSQLGPYPADGAINGNRTGSDWGQGGGWNDANSGVWPDWIQINFKQAYPIREIDVFGLGPSVDFGALGSHLVEFTVEYWDGKAWAVVPDGDISGNNFVWRRLLFSKDIRTDKIRVTVNYGVAGDHTRLTEIEAWSPK